MTFAKRLVLPLALAALPFAAFAQPAGVKMPPMPEMPRPDLTQRGPRPQEKVTPAAEVTRDKLVQPGDAALSCDALRGEIRGLVALLQQKGQEAEVVQRARFEAGAAERLAAADRSRVQDKANQEADLARAKAGADRNSATLAASKTDPADHVASAEFKGNATAITPSEMRYYRLAHISYEKGC